MEEELIDRVLEKEPMIFIDEIEIEILKLKQCLKYFDLNIDNIYFR